MNTDSKPFDCVEFMHEQALRIHEHVKDMTLEEELAYWSEMHVEQFGKSKADTLELAGDRC